MSDRAEREEGTPGLDSIGSISPQENKMTTRREFLSAGAAMGVLC